MCKYASVRQEIDSIFPFSSQLSNCLSVLPTRSIRLFKSALKSTKEIFFFLQCVFSESQGYQDTRQGEIHKTALEGEPGKLQFLVLSVAERHRTLHSPSVHVISIVYLLVGIEIGTFSCVGSVLCSTICRVISQKHTLRLHETLRRTRGYTSSCATGLYQYQMGCVYTGVAYVWEKGQ